MDKYQPQTSGMSVKEGHQELDFNLRGIVLFIVILVLSAILTFLAAWGLMHFFEWLAKRSEAAPTHVQKQLSDQRGGEPIKPTGGVRPRPDWYNREADLATINRTFATPRLQSDDTADMKSFRNSENERLNHAGKDADGTIHIPISQAIDI